MSNKDVATRSFAQSPTRRLLLAQSVALGTGIALGTTTTGIGASPSGADRFIHQEVDFKASPARIYEALLDEQQFSAFSEETAQIQREAGGAFKLFGGRVIGRNVELIPNQRLVQAWRAERWPSGIYSIVRFELTALGSGTRIVFDQTGFPPENLEQQNAGWPKFYWDRLRKYLDS
jgi:activator of HSP90 ATPase